MTYPDDEEFLDEHEENVYKESSRDELVDNDEISPEEEAFMKGYDEQEEEDPELDETDDD